MPTECSQLQFQFQDHFSKKVVADFEGGEVTSDGGALLLREADLSRSLTERFVDCFRDGRDSERTQHSLPEMIRQRVYGLALGYEDVIDHEELRQDPLFTVLAGREDFAEPLAGKSTLNRMEVSASRKDRNQRYHRIDFSLARFHALCRALFLESFEDSPAEVILDLDATDTPTHGDQEETFFHGYYDHYCYLPLYIFCGDHLLHAELRPANIDAAAGSLEALAPIVEEIKQRWPNCRIIVRGDSGFCRDWLMQWCEERGVSYILGLAKNERLKKICARKIEKARRRFLQTGEPVRFYKNFGYRTRKSWSARRRVVAKCEHLAKGENPRFIVTNLLSCEINSIDLYENGYCPRGDMENRIKEQLDLFGDRLSCSAMAANQLRLAFSAIAYTLMGLVREALRGTALERARPETIRLKLLKIGARMKRSVRRFVLSFASGYPWKYLFTHCYSALRTKDPPGQPA